MNIRLAGLSDSDAVLELLAELRRSGYREMGVEKEDIRPAANAPDAFMQALDREDVHIILAENADQPVGVCVAVETPKLLDGTNRLLIEEMVVAPDHRGTGVGSALMAYVEQLALERHIRMIKVTTGTKLRANDFYKKRGYTLFENAYRKKLT